MTQPSYTLPGPIALMGFVNAVLPTADQLTAQTFRFTEVKPYIDPNRPNHNTSVRVGVRDVWRTFYYPRLDFGILMARLGVDGLFEIERGASIRSIVPQINDQCGVALTTMDIEDFEVWKDGTVKLVMSDQNLNFIGDWEIEVVVTEPQPPAIVPEEPAGEEPPAEDTVVEDQID